MPTRTQSPKPLAVNRFKTGNLSNINKLEPAHSIESYTINSKKYTLFIIIYLFGGTGLVLLLGLILNSPTSGVIGYIIIMLSPFILKKQFRKKFIKKATLKFDKERLLIKQFNVETNASEGMVVYGFNEIDSYKIFSSTKNDLSKLTLKSIDGRKIKYTFINQKHDCSENDIAFVIRRCIREYNMEKGEDGKISLIPNLFATKAGQFYIVVLTVLLGVAIIMQLIYKPKTIPFSLFAALAFYLQILVQRKKDIAETKE